MKPEILYTEVNKIAKKLRQAGFDEVLYLLQQLTSSLEKELNKNRKIMNAIKDQNRLIEDQDKEIQRLRGRFKNE